MATRNHAGTKLSDAYRVRLRVRTLLQESRGACANCAAFKQSVWLLYIDGLKLPAGCCAI